MGRPEVKCCTRCRQRGAWIRDPPAEENNAGRRGRQRKYGALKIRREIRARGLDARLSASQLIRNYKVVRKDIHRSCPVCVFKKLTFGESRHFRQQARKLIEAINSVVLRIGGDECETQTD